MEGSIVGTSEVEVLGSTKRFCLKQNNMDPLTSGNI